MEGKAGAMGRVSATDKQTPILSQDLLLSVAEELKMPLMQIARLSEQAGLSSDSEANAIIQATADGALQLLDNYILGVRLALDPQSFNLESVSISSILYDAGQQLYNLAKNYGVELELNVSGRFGPVTANRKGLEAALVSLGAALIEALPAMNESQLKLQLATHRSRYGLVAGVYASTPKLSSQALISGRKLQKMSRQPFVNLTHTSGAGVFVAETILKAMNLNLTASRHHRLYGLATIIKANNQLQLMA